MINERIFVEKKKNYQIEALKTLQELNNSLGLGVKEVRILNIYDVFNIEEADLIEAKAKIFSEIMVDDVLSAVDMEGYYGLSYEPLPGQYDQRADSAMQCIQLLNASSKAIVKCGRLILLKADLNKESEKNVESFFINPIELRKKDLSTLCLDENIDMTALLNLDGFNALDENGLQDFLKRLALAMSLEDLKHIQKYFKEAEKRQPMECEIRVLDTYWSDHCRHTTFETHLSKITFKQSELSENIQKAYETYLKMRQELKRESKPQTLMDMATIATRHARSNGMLDNLEVSDEINACSVYVNVDHDGVNEKWLLMFKNETHNHPTEIEPLGGASTCIGGAIRDPLSGRSYVYQAMRISGCGNVLEAREQTLENKLPQSVIATRASAGNSSYGNQIGLPTTFVREIYHPNYVAKHLEVGAVVGANKSVNVVRKTSDCGNLIILLGGRTGRDGIGGATGSSKEHNDNSLKLCASEVQKGNAIEERKIQRLFRNEEVSKLIRKCNDFGAGGVCVAIGELADGLEIQLDLVKTKYAGLNPMEIAISESQERMAVVVDASDAQQFIEYALAENLEAYVVAKVTDTKRLVLKYKDDVVVDISRDFINTNGAIQEVAVEIDSCYGQNPFINNQTLTKKAIISTLNDLNVASQKGLKEIFDSSIGSTTVLMPLSGKFQLTPAQASVQKLPVKDGKTTTCSILTYGFNPYISAYSPYLGASYAVIESLAKLIACGGDMSEAYASYQEYFERLGNNPERWGKVTQALLGAIEAQRAFNVYAIGGKDSMSGTFKDIDVPPTLISFVCAKGNTKNIISTHFKEVGNPIYLIKGQMHANYTPNYEAYLTSFEKTAKYIKDKTIIACGVVEFGGAISEIIKMAIGEGLGFEINTKEDVLSLLPGAMVIEASKPIDDKNFILIGHTNANNYYRINGIELSFEEVKNASLDKLKALYPMHGENEASEVREAAYISNKQFKSVELIEKPLVLIPVFPGTNCEYDLARAFEDEGAITDIFIFNNQSEALLQKSIEIMNDKILKSNIIALPGGFSSGDEPDGSAKFIVNVLHNEKIKQAIHQFLDNDGLMIGICNGFQALLKSGLLTYGRICQLDNHDATLFRNNISRHVSTMITTKVGSNNSPWLSHLKVGELHTIPVSHGEGKFVCEKAMLDQFYEKGQIAFQYADLDGNVSHDPMYNINGSYASIEGLISSDGKILGKMGHSERYTSDVFKNIEGNKKQDIFSSGVRYFTHK